MLRSVDYFVLFVGAHWCVRLDHDDEIQRHADRASALDSARTLSLMRRKQGRSSGVLVESDDRWLRDDQMKSGIAWARGK